MRRWLALIPIAALALSACSSGPSAAAIARDEQPSTTTTTEPPPEGIVIVLINNVSFRPSLLELDLQEEWIVQWVNEDAGREYTIIFDNGTESPVLKTGDVWEFDFSAVDQGVYRYAAVLGRNRFTGLIDTRPQQ